MSYHDILKLDTSLEKNTLNSMDPSGAVLCPNLLKNQFVHFIADNIDIKECSLFWY